MDAFTTAGGQFLPGPPKLHGPASEVLHGLLLELKHLREQAKSDGPTLAGAPRPV